MLITRDAIITAAEKGLKPAHMYSTAHQLILAAVYALFDRNEAVDEVTVDAELEKMGATEKSGGIPYIAELTERVATQVNPSEWVDILLHKARRRRIIVTADEIRKAAYDETFDGDISEHAHSAILKATEDTRVSHTVSIGDSIAPTMEAIRQAHMGVPPGVSTGFYDLDHETGGLHRGDMIIVGGTPSMGKTAFALAIALHVAKTGHTVAVFSLEMTKEQLTMRTIAAEARVSLHAMRNGRLSPSDLQRVAKAAQTIKDIPLYLDDKPGSSFTYWRATCLRRRPRLFVGDYLQLMDMGQQKNETRNDAITRTTRSLKQLCKEIGGTGMILSQLSRDVVKRGGDRRPQLSDLRESGAIEQDADNVYFVYRPEVYKIDRDDVVEELGIPISGRGEVLIEKQRQGPPGRIFLQWMGDWATFTNRAKSDPNEW
jgi:replicative DNA helicase